MTRAIAICVCFAALMMLAAPAFGQCPMCRTALEGSDEGQRFAQKLNRGILVLLAAPFLVVVGVGLAGRRARRQTSTGVS